MRTLQFECVYESMGVSECEWVHGFMRGRVYVCVYTCVYMRVCICMCVSIHVCIRVCVYACV